MEVQKGFLADESGAVTVDWVVLTAAVVGMAISFMAPIRSAIVSMAQGIGETIGLYAAYMQ